MRVLHITNWYPNPIDPVDAQFIKDQIDALHPFAFSSVMHIQVKEGSVKWLSGQMSEREKYWILVAPVKSWFVKEILTAFLLFIFLLTRRRNQFDVINFHIAYPLLTYFHLFRSLVNFPVVINEHWSAYRNNFGAKRELRRIKRIFLHEKNLVTVSRSLANDIVAFSGCADLRISVLPNVLSHTFIQEYNSDEETKDSNNLFMVGCWQPPKQPLVILKAIASMPHDKRNFKLRIGGYGVFEQDILNMISTLHLEGNVEYIGKLSYTSVASELIRSDFFLHASDYETFSVVCLEALWQGVPVVASKVGGIPEFVNETNGMLVEINSVEDWKQALERLPIVFDREKIKKETRNKFSPEVAGKRYYEILQSYLGK